ncbi:hypothetical protein [Catellatospora citrea]|uniref:LigA protein n=1 Tax=Catellatospora citrea TaxID=53366 RepID=A0A8J3KCS6_9ACTN|nr:hypothetical protein [Catellatospora citrea]RKE09327.1 hypothetical protein C8E86_4212 [Catellatospora citrea]GIF97282.1 hypothetical protein Cci01nite_23760 [Catellatospora citrea]
MTTVNDTDRGTVLVDGRAYVADAIAGGAAYELFSETPAPGFLRMDNPGRWAYHRFVPAAEVAAGAQELAATHPESPLCAPLSRAVSWEHVHRLSQRPPRDRQAAELVGTVRASATVRRGTRMVMPLNPTSVTALLRGRLPHGFCYREWDLAHLRTPAELAVLGAGGTGAQDPADEIAYLLRWRAVDPRDYMPSAGDAVAGLVAMPPHDRVGAAVLGTGFAPSSSELIPEWITADFADLPLPAHAALVAYVPDGTEIVLYTFQPEQRGWLRLVGPQWRRLLHPLREISADQEYLPIPRTETVFSRLIGTFRGEEYEAVADPPEEFRVLAMSRAARYPVESLLRRTRYAHWRGAPCTVLGADSTWVRLRLCRPDPQNVAALGAQCYERGVYEAWAPATEVTDAQDVDIRYPL